jgi:hypothetical protein
MGAVHRIAPIRIELNPLRRRIARAARPAAQIWKFRAGRLVWRANLA